MESLPRFHSRHTEHLKMLERLLAISSDEKKARYLIGKLLPCHCSGVMKFLGRLVAFVLLVVSFPRLAPMFDSFASTVDAQYSFNPNKFKVLLPVLFHDLANEGLLRGGERALFLGNEADYEAIYGSSMLPFDSEMDHISIADSERQNSAPDNIFDFAFTCEYNDVAVQFIDRTLTVGGLMVVQLGGENPNNAGVSFQIPSNYRIKYIRRFDSPVLALKKIDEAASGLAQTRRRLLGLTSRKKREALNNLEDVLLEPPRAATGRSSRYLKKTRYLPDLTGDDLAGYPRRVFIDVGSPEEDGRTGTKWFVENYPTRNLDFDMYEMETVAGEDNYRYPSDSSPPSNTDPLGSGMPRVGMMSEWLKKNVREEEYVVMKADAEVAEEVMDRRATGLIDELFLECNPKGKEKKKKKGGDAINGSNKRAYWECLALYGRLRDEGVAVHQWWGYS